MNVEKQFLYIVNIINSRKIMEALISHIRDLREELDVLKKQTQIAILSWELKMQELKLDNIILDKKLCHIKKEIEMQQRIELEEETCSELKQVFASLQQQVDFKRDKLKRINNKLQSIRQEIKDNHEVYLKDRQEIENANDEATVNLRQAFLIIDNFVPSEERSRIISLAQFDENLDNWIIRKETEKILPSERPRAHNYRRPISDYAIQQGQLNPKYRGENILDLKLDMPLRTTQDYTPPAICPQIKALVTDVIKKEMENCHVTIKMAPHSMSRSAGGGVSKLEQEGKYKQALRTLVDVNSLKASNKPVPPRSAKSAYHLK